MTSARAAPAQAAAAPSAMHPRARGYKVADAGQAMPAKAAQAQCGAHAAKTKAMKKTDAKAMKKTGTMAPTKAPEANCSANKKMAPY